MTAPVQHYIDLGDGVQRELRYSIATARRLSERFGTFGKSLTSELAIALPEMIHEGFKNPEDRTKFTPEIIADMIDLHRGPEYQEIVLAAMGGVTVEEFKKRIAEAEAEAKKKASEKNERAAPVLIQ